MGPRNSFLPANDAADELARRGARLALSAVPCSLFSLVSRIHSCLFSDWRRTVSSKFFDTQVSSISIEELVLPRHARCVLSWLRCNGHSLLLSSYLGLAESRILPAAPVDTRPRKPLISFCTVQLRTLCPAHSLMILCLSTTSGPGHGEFPGFWGTWSSAMPPIPWKGSGNQQQYDYVCFGFTCIAFASVYKPLLLASYEEALKIARSKKPHILAEELIEPWY